MKRLTLFLIAALFVGMSAAQVKNVAVVETEVDAQSGASAKLTPAEVRLITTELRREAVKNLPRDKYNIMTSETVIAQGGAVLEECAEENCVIALGSKIGADYIVRGTISKFQTKITLSVEMYETENGNLVASSDPVRSEKVGDLLEKAAAACAGMYKTFANTQNSLKSSSSAKPAPKGLDLDKLLVDDEEGDLLTEEKPAVHNKPAAGDSAAAGHTSAKTDGHSAVEGEGAKPADSVGRASAPQTPGRRGPPASKTDYDAASAGPAVVEDGRTINFAQNLKEYKSPRVAMLLSLLVPGLGQAYARNYIKASAFVAAEIVAIGTAVYINSEAKSQKKDAYDFADKHFNVKRIMDYDSTLRDEFVARGDNISRDSVPLPYDKYFYDAAKNKDTYFYESVRGKEFTPGWEDYNLSLNDVLDAGREMLVTDEKVTIIGTDGSRYELYDYRSPDKFYYVKKIFSDDDWVLGHSNYQARYNAMIDKSNSYRDAVNYVIYVILLNHIASSIDAGFTARAYNARLLGEDNSAWNRVSVEQQFVFTGSEVSPGVSLRLRF